MPRKPKATFSSGKLQFKVVQPKCEAAESKIAGRFTKKPKVKEIKKEKEEEFVLYHSDADEEETSEQQEQSQLSRKF